MLFQLRLTSSENDCCSSLTPWGEGAGGGGARDCRGAIAPLQSIFIRRVLNFPWMDDTIVLLDAGRAYQ